MKKVLIYLFLICSALATPLYNYRNYYRDEVYFTRTNATFGNTGTLKTLWGSVLAENVTWFLTEDMTNKEGFYNPKSDHSRITHIITLDEIQEIPKMETNKFLLEDAKKYAYRISAYINDRYQNQITKNDGNKLIFTYPESADSASSLINNLHTEYEYIHVVSQSYGWSFEKP